METKILKAYGDEVKDAPLMEMAGKLIKAGELVAIPTETVYGLAGDALNPLSAKKIYAVKGRPSDNPLIVHIADFEHINKIVSTLPSSARRLAKEFWPGPLTMVLHGSGNVPRETTGNLESVAVRMPSNPISRHFIKASGGYIAAPSANRSGRPSCTTALHVLEDIGGQIPLIIDGGASNIGLESTIVDLTGDVACLLRPGAISLSMLRGVLGQVDVDSSIDGTSEQSDLDASIASIDNAARLAEHPKAPGMKYKHYAPRGELFIVEGERNAVIRKICEMAQDDERKGLTAAVIASFETKDFYTLKNVRCIGSKSDEAAIARELFASLREMDEMKADVIYAEAFDTPILGMAIMNRLIRAAGHKILKV